MKENKAARAITIGIVGGVGSGKSFTTAEFVAQGAAKFDADSEAKKLYEDPEVVELVRQNWKDVLDDSGKLDRAKLAAIVFAPDEEGAVNLAKLNSILHPLLFRRFREWLGNLQDHEFAILDAPLLFEVGWETNVDYVVFVNADEETRRRRTILRGWNPDEITRREARQIPLDVKRARADFIVDASHDDSAMDRQVFLIMERIRFLKRARS